MLAQSNELPFNFARKVAQDRQVGPVDAKRRSDEHQSGRQFRYFNAGKVAFAFEGGERTIAAGVRWRSALRVRTRIQ